MSAHFEATGIEDLTKTFIAASVRVGAAGAALIRTTAKAVEVDAKAFAPVRTGFLRDSISTDLTGDGRFAVMTAEVGPTAPYSVYVEFGTSRMAPQAFLGPAFDRHAGEFLAGAEALAIAALGG